METTPIAQLGPSLSNSESRYIRAIVTLIWPYSSSTRSAALLLAEPDFRLRRKRGQVRIQLRGASAVALARTKIQSGDEILLRLEGAQWVEATPGITTPGKSVDTELLFKRRLVCQILRDGQNLANLDIDQDIPSERSRSPSPSTPFEHPFIFTTPALSRLNGLSTPASSAFHKRARVSGGSLVDSPYDPFVSQVRRAGEPEKKRIRTSWGNEGRWTLDKELPSPTKTDKIIDWIRDEDLQSPPKDALQQLVDVSEPESPISEPSPTAAKATELQIEEMRVQYTQELVNLVSGDTEEDTDMEEPQPSASAIPGRIVVTEREESPLRKSFSVYRDESLAVAETSVVSKTADTFELNGMPKITLPVETVSLEAEEVQFLNLPSGDDHEVPDDIEETAEIVALQEREQSSPHEDQESPEPRDNIDLSLEAYPAQTIMAPPSLPSIQTSNFSSGQITPMGPPSALPRSPETPDIRPQQSATLPLPSPFPGDELATSFDWQQPASDFMTPMRNMHPGIVPDHFFQFGFGFQSSGFQSSRRIQHGSTDLEQRPSEPKTGGQDEVLKLEAEPELAQTEFQLNFPNHETFIEESILSQYAEPELPSSKSPIHYSQEHQSDARTSPVVLDDVDKYDGSFQPPQVLYPDLPSQEEFYGSQGIIPAGKANSPYTSFQPGDAQGRDNAPLYDDFLMPRHAEGNEDEDEQEDEHEDEEDEEDEEDGSEDDEDEFSDEELDEDEEEERDGVRIGAGHRFGPPPTEHISSLKSAPIVIDLLSSSDAEASGAEESELESIDGDEETAQLADDNLLDEENAQIAEDNLIDDEAEEASGSEEDYEEAESYDSGQHEGDEEDEEEESSGSQKDDEPGQSATMAPSEEYSRQGISSLDGTYGSGPVGFIPAPMLHEPIPSSTPWPPQSSGPRRKAEVINLGRDESDSEAEAEEFPESLREVKREITKTQIENTYEPAKYEHEPMEKNASFPPSDKISEMQQEAEGQLTERDAVTEGPTENEMDLPSADESTKHQFSTIELDIQESKESENVDLELLPKTRRRAGVAFAPRVTRRQPAGSQLTTQLEPQSSIPLAFSQESAFRRPKLVIQDTFEGMVQSEGSATTAPPSSWGQDSAAESDEDEDEVATQKTSQGATRHESEDIDDHSGLSAPVAMFDGVADSQVVYPDLRTNAESEALDLHQSFSHPRAIPQHALGGSTLPATPDDSQISQTQSTFEFTQQQSILPPTPQLTQRTSNQSFASAAKEEEQTITTTLPEDHLAETPGLEMEQVRERFPPRARRALSPHQQSNDAPSIISPWFAPRRSSQRHLESNSPQPDNDVQTQESETVHSHGVESQGIENGYSSHPFTSVPEPDKAKRNDSMKGEPIKSEHLKEEAKEEYPSSQLPAHFSFSQTQSTQTKGLLTSLSYYTPLSNLTTHLSIPPSSSQLSSSFSTGIDIIAVATKSSTKPLRAEKGPKDYGTTFLLTDQSFWPNKVRVQVFRPWKLALPVVEKGDVVLLRGFDVVAVKSGIGVGLRSGEGSAWCVWKFGDKGAGSDEFDIFEDDPPAWAKKEGAGKALNDREDVRGPPVERGEDEREFVEDLRGWWVSEAEMKENGSGYANGGI